MTLLPSLGWLALLLLSSFVSFNTFFTVHAFKMSPASYLPTVGTFLPGLLKMEQTDLSFAGVEVAGVNVFVLLSAFYALFGFVSAVWAS